MLITSAVKACAASSLLRAVLLFVLVCSRARAQVNGNLGSWTPKKNLPVIPVAAALREDGHILMWSAFKESVYDRKTNRFVTSGGGTGKTQHAIYHHTTGFVNKYEVSNTGHDMFCPSISILFNGDIIVGGGQDSDKSSLYDRSANKWVSTSPLNVARGYASSITLADGRVLTLGGSWSGDRNVLKPAELYLPKQKKWVELPGIDPEVILTNDPQGLYRADNYAWLFAWRGHSVFHAGPSKQMNWFKIWNGGDVISAGTRPGQDAHNGNAVMYDARFGKILTFGGSQAFARPEFGATGTTVLVDIGKRFTMPSTKVVGSLNKPRVYGNGVVLPNGQIVVLGGSEVPKEFSDEAAIFDPEIYDPNTEKWTLIKAKHKVPRTYHSTALLLKDGRVFHGGGGLCNCAADHLDSEIFSPPYLFKSDGSPAPRPTISLNAGAAQLGTPVIVTADKPLSMISAVRLGSVTHSTNTDQRRIELCGPTARRPCYVQPGTSSTYRVRVPGSSGSMVRGNWMIFGMDAAGVPSVGVTLLAF